MRGFLAVVGFFWSLCSFANASYLVGAGISDVTDGVAGIGMMGYAKPEQETAGIHTRLYARAFVIEDIASKKRLVLVSADLGMIFESVKVGVIEALKKKYGKQYDFDNVLISATHTHSGAGGYALHTLYNLTIKGFYQPNYQTIVNGIVSAIDKATVHLEPAYIFINQGELIDASTNRSLLAYEKNPEAEKGQYAYDTDKSMLVLKVISENNEPIGMLNWFAVHGVSMSNENHFISGDNKGIAAYLFEKAMNVKKRDKPFVAAFFQANEGDATPNLLAKTPNTHCHQFDCQDLLRTLDIGQKQYQKAKVLYESATTPLQGGIDYRHQYINMDARHVANDANDEAKTCHAALGYSFAAGTIDGLGAPFFYQGQLKTFPIVNALSSVIKKPSASLKGCQLPKPILLAVGDIKPHSWLPESMPVQLFRLGQLAIIGAPGEFTTMSGRRIKKAILNALYPLVDSVAFTGLSNSYAGYITTFEEYQQQNYEGGFTVFGPYTAMAYQNAFTDLAMALKNDEAVISEASPHLHKKNTLSLIMPVAVDNTPQGKDFGDIAISLKPTYEKGSVVHVAFWAGHPRNNTEAKKSFLEVQRLEKGIWQTLYYDWDINTLFKWERVGISYSKAHIYWQIHQDEKPGTYRILHHGHYKYLWNQKTYAYLGKSSAFKLI